MDNFRARPPSYRASSSEFFLDSQSKQSVDEFCKTNGRSQVRRRNRILPLFYDHPLRSSLLLPPSFSSRDIRCPLLSRSESRSSALSLLAKRRVISNRSLNLTLRNDLTRDGDRRRCPNGGECGSWPQRRGARHGLLLHDSGAPRHLDEGRLDGNAPAAGTLQISIGLRNYRVSQS